MAVTGKSVGFGLFDTLAILGRAGWPGLTDDVRGQEESVECCDVLHFLGNHGVIRLRRIGSVLPSFAYIDPLQT